MSANATNLITTLYPTTINGASLMGIKIFFFLLGTLINFNKRFSGHVPSPRILKLTP